MFQAVPAPLLRRLRAYVAEGDSLKMNSVALSSSNVSAVLPPSKMNVGGLKMSSQLVAAQAASRLGLSRYPTAPSGYLSSDSSELATLERRSADAHHHSYWNRTLSWTVNERESNLLRHFGSLGAVDLDSLAFGGRDNRSKRVDGEGVLGWAHDPSSAGTLDGAHPRSIWETLPALQSPVMLQNLLRAFFPSSFARGGGTGFTLHAFDDALSELNEMLGALFSEGDMDALTLSRGEFLAKLARAAPLVSAAPLETSVLVRADRQPVSTEWRESWDGEEKPKSSWDAGDVNYRRWRDYADEYVGRRTVLDAGTSDFRIDGDALFYANASTLPYLALLAHVGVGDEKS